MRQPDALLARAEGDGEIAAAVEVGVFITAVSHACEAVICVDAVIEGRVVAVVLSDSIDDV
jgi:hypothetical protein